MSPGVVGSGAPGGVSTRPVFGRALAWAVCAIGALAILGWYLDVEVLMTAIPGDKAMKFNTAVCLLGLGATLLVRWRRAAWALLAGVLVIAGLTLVEILFGVSFGIDELGVADRMVTPGSEPGRMAPATAVALVALCVSVAALFASWTRLAQALLPVPLLIGAMAFLGYLFGVEELYRVASFSTVAVHTAVSLVLLALAVAALVPDGLFAWASSGRGPGALVLRWTVPVVVAGTVVIGLVTKYLMDSQRLGHHFSIAVMVLASLTITLATTGWAARRLDVSHLARTGAEDALHELNESLVAGRDEAWARAEALADELDEERARFERAVSGTQDLVWTAETTGGTIVLRYSSPNVAAIFGGTVPVGYDVGQAIARQVHRDDAATIAEFREAMVAGRPAEMEIRVQGYDGRQRWVWVRGAPRTEGERSYYDGIITNVTERHELAAQRERLLEQEQVQVRELSELNRLRDEFIAVASHELRTPMAVIVGYCELLAEHDISAESQREALDVVARRAAQMSELINQIFDLSTVDAGQMDLTLEPIEVPAFLGDLVAEHQPAAVAAGLTLSVSASEGTVLANRPRLRQVFDNLLSNAVKYTPAGGRIQVSATEVGPEVRFDVSDDGVGVPVAELPRLFDRLYRATSARDSTIPGTGLGLAVAKALVERQGGSLTANANEPHGLVLSVTLPCATADVPAAG